MPELPLEAATADVIARYKRGNDMLASAAIAMRRLKERIEAGEAGDEWNWAAYVRMHLEPHMGKRWIQAQLKLAPPGASEKDVQKNVDEHRTKKAQIERVRRSKSKNEPRGSLVRTSENSQAEPDFEEPTRQIEETEIADDAWGYVSDTRPAGGVPSPNGIGIEDPVSACADGIRLLLWGIGESEPAEVAENYPPYRPLFSDDLLSLINWLSDLELAFRAIYGVGNPAAMEADAH